VDDEVKHQLYSGAQQHGCCKGGINDSRETVLPGKGHNPRQVRHLHQGVADGLNTHNLGGEGGGGRGWQGRASTICEIVGVGGQVCC